MYGCETWDLKQSQPIDRFSVSWNKAMRNMWCLPPHSHRSYRSYLAGLTNRKHVLDRRYAKSVTMKQRMAISKSNKVCFPVNISFNDQSSLVHCNFNTISKAWRTGSSSNLTSMCSNIKPFNIYSGTSQDDKLIMKNSFLLVFIVLI